MVGPPAAWALRGKRGYLVKTAEEAREAVRKKKAAGIEIIKFNEYVAPEVIKAGAEKTEKLGLPITCRCLDVFLAAENNFSGVEHHWGMRMTTIGNLKKPWEVHERRMTGKINTADLAYFYETENFDKAVKAAVAKNITWSPTFATWYRPLSPSVARFKERELSILDQKNAGYLPRVLREQALGSTNATLISHRSGWRSTPQEVDLAPRSLAQGASGTIKVTARGGFDKFHKVMLNGKEIETHFVSGTELEASLPAQMTKVIGTYPIVVVGQGDFASRSAPAYFIVSYQP